MNVNFYNINFGDYMFLRGCFLLNIKQSVQTALENNESLKSQKALLDNSYQNILIQKGTMLQSLSLSSTGLDHQTFIQIRTQIATVFR